jgi:hypothetical protein
MKSICCVLIVATVPFVTATPASAAIYYDPYLGGFAYESAASYSYDSYLSSYAGQWGDVNSTGTFYNADLQALLNTLRSGLSSQSVSAIDTSTSTTTSPPATLTLASGSPSVLAGNSGSIATSPEPSTFILAALALACLFVHHRQPRLRLPFGQ